MQVSWNVIFFQKQVLIICIILLLADRNCGLTKILTCNLYATVWSIVVIVCNFFLTWMLLRNEHGISGAIVVTRTRHYYGTVTLLVLFTFLASRVVTELWNLAAGRVLAYS